MKLRQQCDRDGTPISIALCWKHQKRVMTSSAHRLALYRRKGTDVVWLERSLRQKTGKVRLDPLECSNTWDYENFAEAGSAIGLGSVSR